MHLSLRDIVTIDVLLEQLQNSAVQDGEIAVAKIIAAMREQLPTEDDVIDAALVMQIQTLLAPLLDSNDPASSPDAIKTRIREVLVSLDIGRISQ